MDDVKKTASSKLRISEDVIITVARLAALDVIVSEQTFLASSMVIGDVFTIQAISPRGSDFVRLRVVGVFDITDPSEVYWQDGSKFFTSALFVQCDAFLDYFVYNPNRSKFSAKKRVNLLHSGSSHGSSTVLPRNTSGS